MKLLHVADLHLGKSLHNFSLLEEQRDILDKIINIALRREVDAFLLAGDIFDKSNPSQEAIRLFDDFLATCVKENFTVFIISGNHDSPTRLGFGGRVFAESQIFVATEIEQEISVKTFVKGGETVDVYLLPYVRKLDLERLFPESGKEYSSLMAEYLKPSLSRVLERKKQGIPSLLLAHQWLVNQSGESLISDSELSSLGLVEVLPAELFSAFDYLALGHLHRQQKVAENGFYPGSPLPYSASEAKNISYVILLDVHKGEIRAERIALTPLRKLHVLEGSLAELLKMASEEEQDDYVFLTLRDEGYQPNLMKQLRGKFNRICEVRFPVYEGESDLPQSTWGKHIESASWTELFSDFFRQESGGEMSEMQYELCKKIFSQMEEE